MHGNPKSTQDNQFKGTDNKATYIQGPVHRITPTATNRAINDVRPVVKFSRLKRPLSSPAYFQAILLSSGPAHKSQPKRRLKKLSRIQILFLSAAAAFLLMGGYFTYVGIKSVKASALQVANNTNSSDHSSSSGGADSPGLSTVKVTASDLASYNVAPNLPRYLKIPSLGVNARVLSVGLTSGNAIGTPTDIYDTAWYNGSAQPGQPGAVLIDGHVSSWSAHGVFYNLKSLTVGDQIQIQRGDGAVLNYKVVKSQVYPANDVNMKAALSPIINGQQGLNLITCTGQVLPGSNGYNERLVVFATQT